MNEYNKSTVTKNGVYGNIGFSFIWTLGGPHDAAEMEECDSGPFAPDLDHTSVGKWRVFS